MILVGISVLYASMIIFLKTKENTKELDDRYLKKKNIEKL